MSSNLPPRPPESPRHSWAAILASFRDLRHLAFDPSLDGADRARRIRDRFGEYDGLFADDC